VSSSVIVNYNTRKYASLFSFSFYRLQVTIWRGIRAPLAGLGRRGGYLDLLQ
jgi:hypothetical protein